VGRFAVASEKDKEIMRKEARFTPTIQMINQAGLTSLSARGLSPDKVFSVGLALGLPARRIAAAHRAGRAIRYGEIIEISEKKEASK
jgi:hypothetical protein